MQYFGDAVNPSEPTGATRLDTLMKPKAVAIFGISSDCNKIGNVILGNVISNGFAGSIYGIAREPMEIAGATIVTSVHEVPETIDILLIALPADRVLEIVRALPRGKVNNLIVVAAGYSEIGAEGAAMERELGACCREKDLVLVGPNCQGVSIPPVDLQMTFSPNLNGARSGRVAVLSQSGALGGLIANRLMRRGVGLSCFVSSGNETCVTMRDFIAAAGRDPETRVIFCYIEQIRDGPGFVEAVRSLGPGKRIVGLKTGRSKAGTDAVRSHTGAIAGDDRVIDGVFKQLAIIRVRDSSAAIDAVNALATQPALQGTRIGILSIAGGLGVEMADLLEMHDFEVPAFEPETVAALKQVVPSFGATRNPIDLTAAVLTDSAMFEKTAEIVDASPSIDAIVFIVTFARDPRIADAIVSVVRKSARPVLVCWTGDTEQTPESLAILEKEGIPIYDSPARCLTAFRALRGDASVS